MTTNGTISEERDLDDDERILHPQRLRDPSPRGILLPFQPAQINRGHRQRRMVQERTNGLDRFADIAPELGSTVTQDMHAASANACRVLVTPQSRIVGGTRHPFGSRACLPARWTK